MNSFCFSGAEIELRCGGDDSACFHYALDEIRRLLHKIGIVTTLGDKKSAAPIYLVLGDHPVADGGPVAEDLNHDGYRLSVGLNGVAIVTPTAKGLLNGVYDFAERLGYVFLLPGDAGEWAPESPAELPLGDVVAEPLFPHRGVFWQPLATRDFSAPEWLRFYAKLRFNALATPKIEDRSLAQELGLRFEAGGHGLSSLLPRHLFAEKPELFRMGQPEDFGGQRVNDSNFCVTNPNARSILKASFRRKLASLRGVYAIHAWADDLPAGGWCLCPCCRAFSPADQSMLAMNLLAETVREDTAGMRIATIAYHDTLSAGSNIDPAPETFLLFAPRERCYGHALDDGNCCRNRFYMDALKSWQKPYAQIGDAHVFEYYFDQILFRGLYPFLPDSILGDMRTYRNNGIETYFSLQVAGPALAPDYNMLLFAAAHWNEGLSAESFCQTLTARMAPDDPAAWRDYLQARGAIFSRAMRTCDHDLTAYMDYRWLPETTQPYGQEMAREYADASRGLYAAAERLESGVPASASHRLHCLASTEANRARFESAEFLAMHHQQGAVNDFAAYLNGGTPSRAEHGCKRVDDARDALKNARARAVDFALPDNSWYFRNINQWLDQELLRKQVNFQSLLEST